ncbi:MAG: insulinase family protein [bacterium]
MLKRISLFLFFFILGVLNLVFKVKSEDLINRNLNLNDKLNYLNYDWNKVIEDKKKEFDKSWNNFLDTNFFSYNLQNSKYYNFSVIYKYGLKDEDVNIVGIRFLLFYLIKNSINKKLIKERIYFKDELIINEDYIGFNYILINPEDIKKIYTLFNQYTNFEKIYDIDNEIYNFNELKKEVKKEIESYYESSINPVIFFFKQQIFTAHPYYYLPYGNYNNIEKITINDLKKIDLSKIEKFYILIGPNSNKIYQQIFTKYNQFNYNQFNNNEFNNKDFNNIFSYSKVKELNNSYNDYSNYRFIDIKRTRVLSFDIDSKNSYDIFLFSFPSFYQNYKEYLAMLIIDNLLCDDLVGIFYKDLRENKGIIYSLYSFYPNLFLTSYYLIILASDSSSNEFKVFYIIKNILENIDKIENINIEINEAKNRVINKIYLSFDTPYSLANSLIYPLLYKNKLISSFYLINNLYYLDNEYIKQIAKKYLINYYSFRLIGKDN